MKFELTQNSVRAWPRRMTICGIPELLKYADQGVSHVLSILDPQAELPLIFTQYPFHHRAELRFDDVIGEYHGYQAPREQHVETILEFGEHLGGHADGVEHLLVHCHMGISRSTAAMAILLSQLRPGHEAAAFETIFKLRPRAWPNSRMVAIADRLLQRQGALNTALRSHQQRIIQHHPDIAELVINVGRGHELPR